MKSSMNFLAHIISAKGIRTHPDKIKSITEFSTPRDVKWLGEFLALMGYYCCFLLKYADTMLPLLELVKKNTEWWWDPEQKKSVLRGKKFICR